MQLQYAILYGVISHNILYKTILQTVRVLKHLCVNILYVYEYSLMTLGV